MGIPEGVRQVIGRRLSRLSDDANKLLTAASGFNGPFHIDLAGAAAGLDEIGRARRARRGVAGAAPPLDRRRRHLQLHARLIRHTLYGELSPSRQVRLHRQIAEAMERVYGDRANDHAAELAYQYHRSAAIAGAERGVPHALAAADQAEAAYAHDEAAQFLGIAVDLLPADDARRPRLLARFAVALAWSMRFDESVATAIEAATAHRRQRRRSGRRRIPG